MKRVFQSMFVLALVIGLVACGQNQADPNSVAAADNAAASPAKADIAKITIPEGTRLRIALKIGRAHV